MAIYNNDTDPNVRQWENEQTPPVSIDKKTDEYKEFLNLSESIDKEVKINIQYNIGKCKYVVSYSYGDKKHKDGSEFFDIAIFKSKVKMNKFITKLQSINH